jgi:hypothetical protein
VRGHFQRAARTAGVPDSRQISPTAVTPVEGDAFVLVEQAVSGATIDVVAEEGQIGSGSGTLIGLTRPLVGKETITVIEELPGCLATNGLQIEVFNP